MFVNWDWLVEYRPDWETLLWTVAVSFLSLEIGYWVGGRSRRRQHDGQEVLVRTVVGAMVSLLAFVLAVTFWIAATHFDGARQYRLNEANAIRVAYMHAELLPEPHRAEIRNLLREYVDVRLEEVRSGNLEQATSRGEAIQNRLWSLAAAAREKTSNPIFDGYLSRSLNELIAIHGKRVVVYREFSIPALVWVALYIVSALAMASVGFHAGLTCESRPLVVPAFVLIYSVVMILVADLDSPRAGVFRLSERALVDVRKMMGASN